MTDGTMTDGTTIDGTKIDGTTTHLRMATARRTLQAILGALLAVVVAGSCSAPPVSDGTAPAADPAEGTAPAADPAADPADGTAPAADPADGTAAGPRAPLPFDTWAEVYVDTERPTPAGASTAEVATRTLPTTIRLPDTEGPVPLIVFAHGLSGHPRLFSQLLDAWGAAGYASAAPAFPLTNRDVPSSWQNWTDLANQPGDVSFVLDRVLADAADPAHRLHGRIDADRVGVAGMSLGGATTYGVVFNDCCADERFRSALVLAGVPLQVSGEPMRLDGRVPLLVVHGDADEAAPLPAATGLVLEGEPPIWFVTLLGGTHAPPYEDDASGHDDLVRALTTRWWDLTLGDDGVESAYFGAADLERLVEEAPNAELTMRP